VGDDTSATPDNESEQVKLTATRTLFQPSEFGDTDFRLVMTGEVKSMLMSPTVVVTMLPALSVQVPVTL